MCFEQSIFKELNPKQLEAVNSLDDPLLIMAGAGSGKTRVLTCRIANLILHGISPQNVLAITFTNKAANEMKSRAEKMIGKLAEKVWISTFHSFCAKILREKIEVTNFYKKNFAIYDTNDSRILLKQCVSKLKLDEKIYDHVHSKISELKNHLISPECYEREAQNSHETNVAQIYGLYQKYLRDNNALDFDDLIFVTINLFKTSPSTLKDIQERFKYILIDEYQDTNIAQYNLMKYLAAKYQNLCVVGDADQSIYSWRGADIRNILNFEKDYPNAKVIKLEQNYRSTKNILRAANEVIKNNLERKPKELWTENELGEKIKFFECADDKNESQVVSQEIQRLVSNEGFDYNEIAILYRTNAQSRLLEEKLGSLKIPYKIIGGLNFYERKEIKDILAYLKIISNPRDNINLLRIINVPRRGIGLKTLETLKTFSERYNFSIFEIISDSETLYQIEILRTPKCCRILKEFTTMISYLKELSKALTIDELIEVLLDETGYLKMVQEEQDINKLESISREENLRSFIGSAKDFVANNEISSLEDFLEHISLITSIDTDISDESFVRLMTIHAAKGLEFPIVFVTGMEEGIFPHSGSLMNELELEEERRACYVAMTRAQKKLYLTAAKKRFIFKENDSHEFSRFIDEIPDKYLEKVRLNNFGCSYKKTLARSNYLIQNSYQVVRADSFKFLKKTSNINWRIGERVNHKKWGIGTIMSIEGKRITISFSNPIVGVKTLDLKAAVIDKI